MGGSVQYPPIQTSNNTGQISSTTNFTGLLCNGAVDSTPRPNIYYGRSSNTGGVVGCRLYYRTVRFNPADNKVMAARLTAGFTKAVKYVSTNWIQQNGFVPGAGANGNNANIQYQITQSVVHPLRLWVLPYLVHSTIANGPTGGVQAANAANVLSLAQDYYSPSVIVGYFDQSNVQINGIPYYRQNFSTPQSLYEELRMQFHPDKGSVISYMKWLQSERIHLYDLTRISDRLQSPTEPVALTFVGIRTDGLTPAAQVFYLIERQDQITMRFTSSDVAIVVGNLD